VLRSPRGREIGDSHSLHKVLVSDPAEKSWHQPLRQPSDAQDLKQSSFWESGDVIPHPYKVSIERLVSLVPNNLVPVNE
jgi:hypothetical protein